MNLLFLWNLIVSNDACISEKIYIILFAYVYVKCQDPKEIGDYDKCML
jgi:hypothetical protein